MLSAPRLTLFNGQRAYVKVTTQTAYVAGVSAAKGKGGAVSYEPEVKTVEAGVTVDVRAMASADRRYATVTLHPKLTRLERMDTIPAPGLPADANAFVQRPVVRVRQLRTTVTTEDGGAILLGGFEESTEGVVTGAAPAGPATRPMGEPVVNNLIEAKGGSRLYVFVRPTLIVQGEQAAQPAQPANPKPSK
jgi:type II secretory pathway component GspD/PulD (secretin)